jgi:surface protein
MCKLTNETIHTWVLQYPDYPAPIGTWDVSAVTNMDGLFEDMHEFNEDLSGWDVSSVTTMSDMFRNATAFNQPLQRWNVSRVEWMDSMFRGAQSFNQPLDAWDVSRVTSLQNMFCAAISFNQPLDAWRPTNVINWDYLFFNACSFRQPLMSWSAYPCRSAVQMFGDDPSQLQSEYQRRTDYRFRLTPEFCRLMMDVRQARDEKRRRAKLPSLEQSCLAEWRVVLFLDSVSTDDSPLLRALPVELVRELCAWILRGTTVLRGRPGRLFPRTQ